MPAERFARLRQIVLKEWNADPFNAIRYLENGCYICITCYNTRTRQLDACLLKQIGTPPAKKPPPPKFSRDNCVNRLNCKDYPWQLLGLNWVEEQAISRVHYFGTIIKLTNRGKLASSIVYSRTVGHFIGYRQDPSIFSDILPCPDFKAYKIVTVFWVNKTKLTVEQLSKYCSIRVERVEAALIWLKENNPCYKDVRINVELLRKWSKEYGKEFVEPELLERVKLLDPTAIAEENNESYNIDSTLVGIENDITVFQPDTPDWIIKSSTILLPEGDLIGEPDSIFAILDDTIDQIRQANAADPLVISTVLYSTIGKKQRLNIYEDKDYLPAGFPILFPYGIGGYLDEKVKPVSLVEFTKWVLQHHSRRFARYWTFTFLMYDILRIQETTAGNYLQVRAGS